MVKWNGLEGSGPIFLQKYVIIDWKVREKLRRSSVRVNGLWTGIRTRNPLRTKFRVLTTTPRRKFIMQLQQWWGPERTMYQNWLDLCSGATEFRYSTLSSSSTGELQYSSYNQVSKVPLQILVKSFMIIFQSHCMAQLLCSRNVSS
jgi:hypothetical protein